MDEHPINGLMENAMKHLKGMIDVNTIVGSPVTTPDGTIIIPVSKVGFGFATGGSDFAQKQSGDAAMFGGGSGAGVSISPVAFLVVGKEQIKLLPISNASVGTADKIIDAIPDMVDKVNGMIKSRKEKKEPSAFDEE